MKPLKLAVLTVAAGAMFAAGAVVAASADLYHDTGKPAQVALYHDTKVPK